MFTKVVDYLKAGVRVVVVLDPATITVSANRADTLQETIPIDGELTIPELLPGFAVRVGLLFQQ